MSWEGVGGYIAVAALGHFCCEIETWEREVAVLMFCCHSVCSCNKSHCVQGPRMLICCVYMPTRFARSLVSNRARSQIVPSAPAPPCQNTEKHRQH